MSPIIIILYNFIAGTICLIYGVNLMSKGLEAANAKMMKKILAIFAGNVLSAFAAGTILTALVQSSTAITVITVGLVNSGLLKLSQAVAIIFGANIGTTITAQLMSFKITDIGWPVLAAGLIIRFASRKKHLQSLGVSLIGFGLMCIGICILNSGVPYIKESKKAYDLFRIYGKNPYIGLFIGMVTTMLVHSSSATVGLTIVLFNSHLISFEAALGLTLGDNIGTCITAQLASLGANLSARRTAWAHTLYNVIGVVIAMIFLVPFSRFVHYATYIAGQNETRLVANAHTLFNIISAMVFLPLTSYYVKFIEWVVRR